LALAAAVVIGASSALSRALMPGSGALTLLQTRFIVSA